MGKIPFLLFCIFVCVLGHGRMLKPLGRSTIWRSPDFKSYDPPVNYEDHSLKCGSVHQLDDPGTECGVCGDKLSDHVPRDHEIGGKYDKGIITGNYTEGQVIDIQLDLTTSHKGFMEWRLCSNPKNETQECFNQHVLQLADGVNKGSKFPAGETGVKETKVRLPSGISCHRCVVQWNYRGANEHGICGNGTKSVGCGPQVTFRACSDITIMSTKIYQRNSPKLNLYW